MPLIYVVINRAGHVVGASADHTLASQVGARYAAALPHAGPCLVRPVVLDGDPDIPVAGQGLPLRLHGSRSLVLPSHQAQRCFVDVPEGVTGRLMFALKRAADVPEDRDRGALVVPSSGAGVGLMALSLTTPAGVGIEGKAEESPTRLVEARPGRWYAWASWLGPDACPAVLTVVAVG